MSDFFHDVDLALTNNEILQLQEPHQCMVRFLCFYYNQIKKTARHLPGDINFRRAHAFSCKRYQSAPSWRP